MNVPTVSSKSHWCGQYINLLLSLSSAPPPPSTNTSCSCSAAYCSCRSVIAGWVDETLYGAIFDLYLCLLETLRMCRLTTKCSHCYCFLFFFFCDVLSLSLLAYASSRCSMWLAGTPSVPPAADWRLICVCCSPVRSWYCVCWPLDWNPPSLAGAHFPKLQDTETSLSFMYYRWKDPISTWRNTLFSSPVRRFQFFHKCPGFLFCSLLRISLFFRWLDVAGSAEDVCLAPIQLCN